MGNKFLDFDKNIKKIYDNLYLDDLKVVVKLPIKKNDKTNDDVRIERFTLANNIFLTSYE